MAPCDTARRGEREGAGPVGVKRWIGQWPVYRQLTGDDPLGRGKAPQSARSAGLAPRTADADRVVDSVCPYCAVGCAQRVYVKDGQVVQIEGNPDSPVSRGRLCPKGSASKQLVTGPQRVRKVRYRPPYGTEWQDLDLGTAMDMVADRVLAARRKGWQDADGEGRRLRRTMGLASLGGATLDNEENYLIKKLFTALGALQVENQARI
jgi:formate dehydrogenase major subunit